MASHHTVPDAQHADMHGHPSQGTYVKIAIFLAIVTAIEVAIYYIDAIRPVLVPILIVLSAVKFIMVVAYFMHLKFDNRMLGITFTASMLVSIAVFIATWLIMNNDAVTQFIGDMSV
jgi:cytochrome c oxidase subunit IV